MAAGNLSAIQPSRPITRSLVPTNLDGRPLPDRDQGGAPVKPIQRPLPYHMRGATRILRTRE